jgi:hypothetical protein
MHDTSKWDLSDINTGMFIGHRGNPL